MITRRPFSSAITTLLTSAALALGAAACSNSDDTDVSAIAPGDTNSDGGGSGGEDAGGVEAGGGSYTPDPLCVESAKKRCAAFGPCCEASDMAFDRAACEETSQRSCSEKMALVKAGKRSFNPDAEAACGEVMQRIVQKCHFTYAEYVDLTKDNTCSRIFSGPVEEGSACEDDAACKQPTDPTRFAYCDQGRCASADLYLEEGDDCPSTGVKRCGHGFFCNSEERCEKTHSIGDTCAHSDEACGTSAYCEFPSSECVAGKGLGGDCNGGFQCISGLCEMGKCVPMTIAQVEFCRGDIPLP